MRVITMSGGRGVLLDTTQGKLLVQATDPESIARAIESWRRGPS
jgi:hypothetical protein